MYHNIISKDICSFQTYYIMRSYDSLEDARSALESDAKEWKERLKETRPKWYKLNSPFAWATIGD